MILKSVKYSLNWDTVLVWGSVLLLAAMFWGFAWWVWRVL